MIFQTPPDSLILTRNEACLHDFVDAAAYNVGVNLESLPTIYAEVVGIAGDGQSSERRDCRPLLLGREVRPLWAYRETCHEWQVESLFDDRFELVVAVAGAYGRPGLHGLKQCSIKVLYLSRRGVIVAGIR